MNEIRTSPQFSVFLVNKPGILAQVTSALAAADLNVIAMTLVDSQEHGVLRLVVDDPPAARTVLEKLNLPMTETDVLCLDLPNQPGALAEIATLLGDHHVNINYAYCTSGAAGGTTTGIFRVADPRRAEKVLESAGHHLTKTDENRP